MQPKEAAESLIQVLLLPLWPLVVLIRRWRLVFLLAVLGGIAGGIHGSSRLPTFEATALLRLDTRAEPLDGQLALLRGTGVRERVVQRMYQQRILEQDERLDPKKRDLLIVQLEDRIAGLLEWGPEPTEDSQKEGMKLNAMRSFLCRSSAETTAGGGGGGGVGGRPAAGRRG